MANGAVEATTAGHAIGETLAVFAAAEGSAAHRHAAILPAAGGAHASRDLADAVHYLCTLHGRYPGVVDMAAEQGDIAIDWMREAAAALAAERAYLTKLVVAAGPLPSTPNQAACEATIVSQRNAIEMIARSERKGCALGAAIGLAMDWASIRPVLDAAAIRFGVPADRSLLPDIEATHVAATAAATSMAIGRAIGFGARQLFVQHSGLWDLLEARAGARRALD